MKNIVIKNSNNNFVTKYVGRQDIDFTHASVTKVKDGKGREITAEPSGKISFVHKGTPVSATMTKGYAIRRVSKKTRKEFSSEKSMKKVFENAAKLTMSDRLAPIRVEIVEAGYKDGSYQPKKAMRTTVRYVRPVKKVYRYSKGSKVNKGCRLTPAWSVFDRNGNFIRICGKERNFFLSDPQRLSTFIAAEKRRWEERKVVVIDWR